MSNSGIPHADVGTGHLQWPKVPDNSGTLNSVRPGERASPAYINRVFRAEMRRLRVDPLHEEKVVRNELLSNLRRPSFLCAQFGNQMLTSNYLLYRHKDDLGNDEIGNALSIEKMQAKNLYRVWNDKLSSYCRDAISRAVFGLIKARGKEVMRGEASLPTFRRSGAIRVRDRGVKLWMDEKKLLTSFNIEPGEWLEMELWCKNIHKSPGYQSVLDRLLSGEYKIGQGQIIIKDKKIFVSVAYIAEITPKTGNRTAGLGLIDGRLSLSLPERVINLGFDIEELQRRKNSIDARRIQAWRLIRGKKVKRHRAKVYRSGTLSKLSTAWQNYQTTFCHQFAAKIVGILRHENVSHIEIPSTEILNTCFAQSIDYHKLQEIIKNCSEKHGISVSQIYTEAEQKRELRKLERKNKKKNQNNQEVEKRCCRSNLNGIEIAGFFTLRRRKRINCCRSNLNGISINKY